MPSHPGPLACASLLAIVVLSGCASRGALDYSISLRDFYGAEGFTCIYDISPDSLQITLTDDFGNPPSVVWQTELTPAQQEAFTRFAGELPLDTLKNLYENPYIDDGYQYTYRLRIGEKLPREIRVNNVVQPQLDPLIDLINTVVPEQFRAASPRGSVAPLGYDFQPQFAETGGALPKGAPPTGAPPKGARTEVCTNVRPGQRVAITDGVGIGDILIGKSTSADVVARYGDSYELIKHNEYSYEMEYSDLGLAFYYCHGDAGKKIFNIEVCSGITSRGIVLGQSTLKDVYELYGKEQEIWDHQNPRFRVYEYEGVQFTVERESGSDGQNGVEHLLKKVIMVDVVSPELSSNFCD